MTKARAQLGLTAEFNHAVRDTFSAELRCGLGQQEALEHTFGSVAVHGFAATLRYAGPFATSTMRIAAPMGDATGKRRELTYLFGFSNENLLTRTLVLPHPGDEGILGEPIPTDDPLATVALIDFIKNLDGSRRENWPMLDNLMQPTADEIAAFDSAKLAARKRREEAARVLARTAARNERITARRAARTHAYTRRSKPRRPAS